MSRSIDRYREVPPPRGLNEPCWLYTGPPNGKGYGPHRESYEARVGPIPDGMHIDHRCRRRMCLQPVHLEPVTQSENEMRKPGRREATTCPRGHELVGANRVVGGGCRACAR